MHQSYSRGSIGIASVRITALVQRHMLCMCIWVVAMDGTLSLVMVHSECVGHFESVAAFTACSVLKYVCLKQDLILALLADALGLVLNHFSVSEIHLDTTAHQQLVNAFYVYLMQVFFVDKCSVPVSVV